MRRRAKDAASGPRRRAKSERRGAAFSDARAQLLQDQPRPAGRWKDSAPPYGWIAANAWRAAAGRIYEVQKGGQLDYGSLELCVVTISTVLILACFALALMLVLRTEREA